MQIDDRVLADLALERGLITREQLDGAMMELAATQPEPGKPAPSLAVVLLTSGLLNEANLYELAQLWRARTMNPSDPHAPTPRVQPSPLRTDPPTESEIKALAPDVSPEEAALANEQTLITRPPPKPATKDARAATGEHKAVRTSSPEMRAVKDPRASTGHGDARPAARDVKALRASSPELRAVQDPRKSTGHGEMKAVPAVTPVGKAKGPPKAPVPKKALTKEDIELATQQTFVERKQTGELPPEAAEAAQYEDYCFKQFILTAELGKGGMGVVWKAWQRDLKRWVAVKFLEGESRDELERFIREAQSVALLSHPNITALYELNKYEENYYIVMEFVDGQTIESLMGKLSVDTCAKAFHQCALALDHAHRNNIIHRDIKPQNIMLTRTMKPYLMDFGLAKQRNAGSSQTMAGMILGTPAYMSPEQAEGKFQKIDKRSDVYSLAATMYAALAGRPPFQGRAVMDTLYKVVHTEPTPLRRINQKVPPELEAVIARAMSKTPAERYRDAREFAADLQRFMNKEPVAALSAPGGRRTMASARGGGSKTGLIIGIVIVALVGLGVLLVVLLRNQQPKSEAPKKADVAPPPAKGDTPPAWADAHARARAELASARATLSRPGAKFAELREHAERALSIASEHPDVPELLILRGRALALLRRPAEAEAAFKRAGHHASAYAELGMLAAHSDTAAAEHFARGADAPGDERDAKFARGAHAMLDGRTREAADIATALLEREARAEYHWLRARAQATASNRDAAEADYLKANMLEPHVARWAEFAADAHFRRKDSAQAEAVLRKVLDFNPDDDDGLMLLARLKHASRDAAAFDLAAKAIALNPSANHLKHRARMFTDAKRYEDAIADCNRILEKDSDSAEAYGLRGAARNNKGDAVGGLSDLERAVKLSPQYANAHINLARITSSQGRNDEARRHVEGFLGCRNASAVDLVWAADFLYWRKEYDRALAVADRAHGIAPDTAELAAVRADILAAKKEYAKAEAEIRRAYNGDPFRLNHELGRIEFAKGRYDIAAELFAKAIGANERSAEAHLNRGNCLYRLQRWKEAVGDLKRAIELKPTLEPSIRETLADAEKKLAGG